MWSHHKKIREISVSSRINSFSCLDMLLCFPDFQWMSMRVIVANDNWSQLWKFFMPMNYIKPRPWGIKGKNVSIFPSIPPAVKLFTPFTDVYIARLLINQRPYRWGRTASTCFLMSGFKFVVICLNVCLSIHLLICPSFHLSVLDLFFLLVPNTFLGALFIL